MALLTFKIAKVSEDELPSTLQLDEPTGNYKTIYAEADTEEEAVSKAEAYVASTKYADIEDKKVLK